MTQQQRRYTLLSLLLLCSAGWVFLMSLDFGDRAHSPATDGVQATLTWVDWRGAGFPRVEAHLSITDRQGEPVRGLTADAFTLTEDGIPITIQSFLSAGEQTVTSMLVIDRSGSMQGAKINGARAAASAYVDQMRPDRDRAGLIAFSSAVNHLQPLSNNVSALKQSINGIRAHGGTLFYDAVYQGIGDLRGEEGRRILLALTDGQDTGSRRKPAELIQLAQDSGIAIYTIGLGQERRFFSELDGETLRKLAHETGGEYYHAPSAGQLAEMYKEIAETVQNEYVLGYDSPTPHLDGTTRHVEVLVERDAGSVIANGSYVVPGVLSSAFNATLFVPLFGGLLLFLLLLLFAPSWLGRWQTRQAMRARAAPASTSPFPPPLTPPVPPAPQAMPGNLPCPHCGQLVVAGKKFLRPLRPANNC
jgi:VWFA-related protein